MKYCSVFLATIIAASLGACNSGAHNTVNQPSKEFIAFGDSLTDNGNLFKATQGMMPTSPTWYEGRFSNDKIWVEDLIESLNALTPNQYSLYDQAYGGATSGSVSIAGSLPQIKPLQQQVTDWLAGHQVNTNQIYSIWIGGNDFMLTNESAGYVANNVKYSVDLLLSKGVKNILILNLPNIATAPNFGTLPSNVRQVLAQKVANYNQDLSIIFSNAIYESNVKVIDIAQKFNDVLQNPTSYGFSNLNVSGSCRSTTGYSLPLNESEFFSYFTSAHAISNNTNEYVFYDPLHPTGIIHKIIANYVFNEIESLGV